MIIGIFVFNRLKDRALVIRGLLGELRRWGVDPGLDADAQQGDPVEPAEPKRAEKTDDEALLREQEGEDTVYFISASLRKQSANSDVDKAVSGNETYEEKKLRLMALARKKREEVAATAKSRLAKMRFSGESDEDSDQVDDFMVSARRAKEQQKEAKDMLYRVLKLPKCSSTLQILDALGGLTVSYEMIPHEDMDKTKEASKPARHAKAPVVSDSEEAEEAPAETVDLPAASAVRAEEPSTELKVGDGCAPSEPPDTVEEKEETPAPAQETDEKEISKESSEQANAEEPMPTADTVSESVQAKPPCVEEQEASEPEADDGAKEEEAQSENEDDVSEPVESEEE
ncbi:unnamed protein product, partial [Symbiodinium microadriaticum]